MGLPRENRRTIRTKLPGDGREVEFHPMQGRDEKLLLMAKESRERDEILSTIKQVVANCLKTDVDVHEMSLVDVEWLFIRIRIESVSNVTRVTYIDRDDDDRRHVFDVDLNKVEVIKPEADTRIKVSDDMIIEMRWPRVDSYLSEQVIGAETDGEMAHELAIECVERIYEGDVVHSASDYPRTELEEFVESLSVDSYRKVMDFLLGIPRLRYVITYKNSRGEEREVVLSTLTDFFRFR